MKTLILTGWGWKDYACAAALALRHHKQADILGMSVRRLPEFLRDVEGYREIVILGVGLESDPALLETALARLAKKGVAVRWISALPFPDALPPTVRSRLDIVVGGGGLSNVVSQHYKIPCDDLRPVMDEQNDRNPFHWLLAAAMYDYRNYQNGQAYGNAIRHIAGNVPESRWADDERRMVEHYKRFGSRALVGDSKAITALREQIRRIAPHVHARVLIYGESGTGKETVALQLHLHSPRRAEPFIAFNCASVTPELLESRFLGHEKGAFTGATETKRGIFEQADGGTLFLDEIGEIPMAAQGVLLRVIEEGRFMRVGEREEVKVDVRVIAATNRDLPAMVRDHKFREDLFYRLNVIPLRTPALRDHKEDIAKIAKDVFWSRKSWRKLTPGQISALQSYDYPGNVRELFNILERAIVLGEPDFAKLISEQADGAAASPASQTSDSPLSKGGGREADGGLPDNLAQAMSLHVSNVYKKYGDNLTLAAQRLGVTRNTVKKYLGT